MKYKQSPDEISARQAAVIEIDERLSKLSVARYSDLRNVLAVLVSNLESKYWEDFWDDSTRELISAANVELLKGTDMSEIQFVGAFSLGHVVVTANCLRVAEEEQIALTSYLARHAACDWGDLDPEDKKSNDFAIGKELRILSAYQVSRHRKIWIITEADRSSTCILLPEDY